MKIFKPLLLALVVATPWPAHAADAEPAQPGTVHLLSASEFALQLVRERTLTLAAYEQELAN